MCLNWNLQLGESVVRFDPKNTLILVALEAELPREMIPSWKVAYTGVGKVNAALKGSENVARIGFFKESGVFLGMGMFRA